MSNIIPFPVKGKDGKSKFLEWIAGTYRKAGLSEDAIKLAVAEFGVSLDKHLGEPRTVVMKFPDCDLTEAQLEAVGSAHDKCVAEIVDHCREAMTMALCEIAGYIGAKHNTSA